MFNTAEHRQTVQPNQHGESLSLPKERLNGYENDQFKNHAPHGISPKSDSLPHLSSPGCVSTVVQRRRKEASASRF